MATISTHNRPDTMVWDHNRRDPEYVASQEHIDPELSYRNKFFINENPEIAFNKIFEEDVEEYNKGKKPSRQIKNYYKKILHARLKDLKKCEEDPFYRDKKGNLKKRKPKQPAPVQEMIVGVYGTNLNWQQKQEIAGKFVKQWPQYFPNLKLIGAYFHGDEPDAEDHMHIDYVCVSDRNKQGMRHKVASDAAYNKIIKEYGYDYEKIRKDAKNKHVKGLITPQNIFENKFAWELCANICKEYGITNFERPQVDSGIKHLETANFKIKTQIDAKTKELVFTEDRLDYVETKLTKKEEEFTELEGKIADKDALIAQKNGQIIAKDAQIEKLQKKNTELIEANQKLEQDALKIENNLQKLQNKFINLRQNFIQFIEEFNDIAARQSPIVEQARELWDKGANIVNKIKEVLFLAEASPEITKSLLEQNKISLSKRPEIKWKENNAVAPGVEQTPRQPAKIRSNNER